jgi:hypothetical protein
MQTMKRWKYAIVLASMACLLAVSAVMVARMPHSEDRKPQSVSSEAPAADSATPSH